SRLLVAGATGRWSLPLDGHFGLGLGPRTRFGALWVRLVFDDPAVPPVLLLRDQLSAANWRQLRLALRNRH
ncbi:MAG: hypothetical protein R3305_03035, partial [Gammaproteobacteria bacterium]|nr:hypothetical protein [Gammaproteobacteria bacterium]